MVSGSRGCSMLLLEVAAAMIITAAVNLVGTETRKINAAALELVGLLA